MCAKLLLVIAVLLACVQPGAAVFEANLATGCPAGSTMVAATGV